MALTQGWLEIIVSKLGAASPLREVRSLAFSRRVSAANPFSWPCIQRPQPPNEARDVGPTCTALAPTVRMSEGDAARVLPMQHFSAGVGLSCDTPDKMFAWGRVAKSRDCPVERNRSRRCIYSPSLP
ncbi:hypothetical protein HaLaN_24786, partial [Haematococcus lacustris]